MYELASLLEHLDPVEEETTMSAIDFLPSNLGDIKKKLTSLAQEMPEWKIEILEQENGRQVKFGPTFSINVSNDNWSSFLDLFDSCSPTAIQLPLKEVIEGNMSDLLKELKPQLIKTFTENPLDEIQLDLNRWKARFGVDKYKHQDVLVSYQNKNNDLRKLYNLLLKAYKDDKGYLEMLIDALEGRTSLASFAGFKQHKFMYGARMLSRFHGARFLFEATVDTEFNVQESAYVEDPDIIDALDKDVRGYKIVGQVVYPTAQRFNPTFYQILEDAV